MRPQLQALREQLGQMIAQLGAAAFNREQAELIYQTSTRGLLTDMRHINGQIQALEEAERQAAAQPPAVEPDPQP